MSSILNIAVSGLTNAAARAANASQNIVNASSTNYTPQDIISLSNGISGGVTTSSQPRPVSPVAAPAAPNNGVDIAGELTSLLAASTDYGADAVVVKTVNKMDQTLLNILA
jgi:flagellar hook-associated protein FlgK